MDVTAYLLPRRWVRARRSLLLPLVLVVAGVGQAGPYARVARDGRPIRPARRDGAARSTLAR